MARKVWTLDEILGGSLLVWTIGIIVAIVVILCSGCGGCATKSSWERDGLQECRHVWYGNGTETRECRDLPPCRDKCPKLEYYCAKGTKLGWVDPLTHSHTCLNEDGSLYSWSGGGSARTYPGNLPREQLDRMFRTDICEDAKKRTAELCESVDKVPGPAYPTEPGTFRLENYNLLRIDGNTPLGAP